MKRMRCILALMTALTVLFSCAAPAFAVVSGSGTADGSDPMDLLLAVVTDAVVDGLPGWGKQAVSWAADKMFEALFPGLSGDEQDDVSKAFEEINARLDEICRMLSDVQTDLTCSELNTILNDYSTKSYYKRAGEVFNSFLDDERKVLPPSTLVKNRKFYVVEGLGIDYRSISSELDDFTDSLFNMITMQYSVSVNGVQKEMTLLEIMLLRLKYKYKWENQAHKEWKKYEDNLFLYMGQLLLLNEMSIMARRDICIENNVPYAHMEQRLETLQNYGKQLKKMEEQEKKVRDQWDDSLRHYWWKDERDIWLYAETNNASVPQEDRHAQLDGKKNIKGLRWSWNGSNWDYRPKFSFWQPFIRYKGGDTLLTRFDLLDQIYRDYGGSKSLWEIFFGEDEGNLIPPNISPDGNLFIIDPESKYPLAYNYYPFGGDEVVCHCVRDPGKGQSSLSASELTLAVYHESYAEPQNPKNVIGIGVYRVGDEIPDLTEYTASFHCPPRTGDDAPVWLWTVLAASGILLLAVLPVIRRRSRFHR